MTNLFDQPVKVRFGQLGVFGFLDVAEILIAFELRMDELIDVAELQFDRRFDVVVANDYRMVVNDLKSALEAAPVIVGEFERKRFSK